jgi:hypothetical protein
MQQRMQQRRRMAIWRDARGVVVAEVAQGVAQGPQGLRAVYYAIADGQAIPKERFKCASDQIARWLQVNRISATMQMV